MAKSVRNSVSTSAVPVFIAAKCIDSQRSSGYNDTLSAVNEFIDNAADADADVVQVYFHPQIINGELISHDIYVLDNGTGMSPEDLQRALAFGGGSEWDMAKIGKFNYGMPNAAVSQGTEVDVYSWQRPEEVYRATLNVEDIKTGQVEGIEAPVLEDVPEDIKELLFRPMGDYPHEEEQEENLLTEDNWPEHGTLICIRNCDKLSHGRTQSFVENAWELGRIYRYKMWDDGLKIYVNNREILAEDPLYLHPEGRFSDAEAFDEELKIEIPLVEPPKKSKRKKKGQEESNGKPVPTAQAIARFSVLPETWMRDKAMNKSRHVYQHKGISVLRSGRELEMAGLSILNSGRLMNNDAWWGMEIHFPPQLDDAMGVNLIKQGVRPKKYVRDILTKEIKPVLRKLRKEVKERLSNTSPKKGGAPSLVEQRAADAERMLGAGYRIPDNPEYHRQVEEKLREFAKTHRRGDETVEQALERIKQSKFLLEIEYIEKGPFYRADTLGQRVVTYINRAHRFYDRLWQPLAQLAAAVESEDDDETLELVEGNAAQNAMAMLLMSFARSEVKYLADPEREEMKDWLEGFITDVSVTLNAMLSKLD